LFTSFRLTTGCWESGVTNRAIWIEHCSGKPQTDYVISPMKMWVTMWLWIWKSVSAGRQKKS
jgi:hypothetical protein